MDKKLIHALKKQLGAARVFDSDEYRVAYSYDATGLTFLPDAVVFPTGPADIRTLVQFASTHRVPLVPRGAGVGYSGGALPVQGGIVLAFSQLNRIIEINQRNFTATVEPGVITADLQAAVEKVGLFYPPDPASLKTSTIGGNVAENAGGPRCFKYGVTGNYVLGLDAVLMNGAAIHAGSSTIKNVAGYDIKSLLIGSEGTLAIFSQFVLKLLPLPQARSLFRVDFASLAAGAAFITQVVHSGLKPSALEFIDQSSLQAVFRHLDKTPDPRIGAVVLVEFDGASSEIELANRRFAEILQSAQPVASQRALSADEQEALWQIRRLISPAIANLKPKKINEDIVVPIGAIPATVDYISAKANELGILTVLFGHFGDGNIHTNLMVDPANDDEMKRADTLLDLIFKHVIACGGTLSGEHGIGITKQPYMGYQFGAAELDLFKRIKELFDPMNLLNPGKII